MKIEAVKTPKTLQEIADALLAFSSSQGLDARPYLPFLLALLDLEHRHGEAIWNNNLGNIVWTEKFGGEYVELPKNPLKFRAYDTFEEGVKGFADLLAKKESMVKAMLAQDDEAFVDAYEKTWLGSTLPTDGRKALFSLIEKHRNLPALSSSTQTVKAKSSDDSNGPLLLLLLWWLKGGF